MFSPEVLFSLMGSPKPVEAGGAWPSSNTEMASASPTITNGGGGSGGSLKVGIGGRSLSASWNGRMAPLPFTCLPEGLLSSWPHCQVITWEQYSTQKAAAAAAAAVAAADSLQNRPNKRMRGAEAGGGKAIEAAATSEGMKLLNQSQIQDRGARGSSEEASRSRGGCQIM